MSAPRLRHAVAVIAVLALCTAVVSSAVAASKPSIRGVALHSDRFAPVWIVAYGAKDVVVCISRRCKPAFRAGAGSWGARADGLPAIIKGESREVIVFAAGPGGSSFLVKRVVVK